VSQSNAVLLAFTASAACSIKDLDEYCVLLAVLDSAQSWTKVDTKLICLHSLSNARYNVCSGTSGRFGKQESLKRRRRRRPMIRNNRYLMRDSH